MPTVSKHTRDGRFSAVTRSYQASRIERELLAQVYDLAQHGFHHRSASLGDQVAVPLVSVPSLHKVSDQYAHQPVYELEAVA